VRLDLSTLDNLPAAVDTPKYDPRQIGIGIVHLGIGAFHRAQTAIFSDDALAIERDDWGICGVSLRSADVRDRLVPQDGLYTAVEKSPAATRRRIIGSVREVLFLGDQRDAIRTRLIEAETRIVSLTITERATATIRRPGSSIPRTRISNTISPIRTSRRARSD